jgi:glycosyltransferase involved in cell wall biosynthesis
MSDLFNTLSIFIPTFNREAKLNELLNQLNSINNNYCNVNIIDNCSVDNTMEVVNDFMKNAIFPLYYNRNEVNVGLSGNLIKCIENCKTDWLWIIGDDDLINVEAFNILSELNLNLISDDTIYINFSTPNLFVRKSKFYSTSLEEFVFNLDSFSNFIFISSSIINIKHLKKHLRFSYIYANTLVPYIPILLSGLKDNNNFKVVFSDKIIATFVNPNKNEKWSYFNYYLNIDSLLEFFSDSKSDNYLLFNKKILETFIVDLNYLNSILLNKEYNLYFKKYLFNNIFFKLINFKYKAGIVQKIYLLIFYIIINFSIARHIYIFYYGLQKKNRKSKIYYQPLNSRV